MLLLDEPLSALDAHTKATVRAELRELLRELGLPTLLVTHDFEDAAVLAERVGVIVDGRLVQIDTPQALVAAPANPFVASLTGANLLEGNARRQRRPRPRSSSTTATTRLLDRRRRPVASASSSTRGR